MTKETIALPTLPTQEKFFSTEKLRKSARAGTNLPDPTMAPYGYDPKAHYRHLFPALELPALFPPGSRHPDDHVSFESPNLEPHRLYLGDNLYVLRQLPSESVDLIYIDPPFFSNRTYTQIWGDDNEIRSFTDIFQDGMFSYLAWLNARLWEMKRVLKSTGSIYVHCDWHAAHYIKCEMDKIFGYSNFINEIVWHYRRWTGESSAFLKMHDVIFLYGKSEDYHYEPQYTAYTGESAFRKQNYHTRIKGDDVFVTNVNEKGVKAHDVFEITDLNDVNEISELLKLHKLNSLTQKYLNHLRANAGTLGLVSCQPCNVVNYVVYVLHNQPGRIGYEEIHRDPCRRRTRSSW